MNRALQIAIPLVWLVAVGLYYGVLPGGDRINWWQAPIRSRGMDAFVGVLTLADFGLLIAGIVQAV
jgi:hypothetical protein